MQRWASRILDVTVRHWLKVRSMEEVNELRARLDESVLQEQLPAFSDLVQRFSLFSASPLCNTQIGQGGSLYCNCEGCCHWHSFVEGRTRDCKEVQYEVFTVEHVKGLAHYLLTRAARYKLPQMNVLEVGAGSGRLCHHLKCFLSQPSLSSQGCIVQLTAADSDERGLNGPNVAKQDAVEAISEAVPHVVLVSWMPVGVDWTAHMRATPSVLEYILIGEIDNGICGDPWLTWGYTWADNLSGSSSESPTSLGISDDLVQTKSFSNNGLGRQVDMVKRDMIPVQSRTQQWGPSVKSRSQGGIGFEGRVEELFVGTAQNHKRLKLGSKSRQRSSQGEDLGATIPIPISDVSSTRIDDIHESAGLQIFAEADRTVGSDMPPYAADGWVRTELASLSSLQICRTDERWSTLQHSHTVSFRRCIPTVFQSNASSY